jgi:hypothetical protein
MTYRGKVKAGVVVVEAPFELPEGTEVTIAPVEPSTKPAEPSELAQSLLALAGRAKGLPSDASINHDHYLYGTPKK